MQKKEALLLKLEELGVLQFGQFTLKSGLSSPFYLDFRRVVAYPQLLKEISEQLWELIKDLEFDHLCGVPYAALSLSSALSMMHNKPMIVKRKEVKKHGTKKMVEGVFEEGQKAVVIDDVISSGISMIETLEVIEAEGLEVDYVISIVDRMQGGVSTLEKQGYQALSVYTIAEILDILYRHDRIDEQMYNLTLAFVQNNQIGYEQLRLAAQGCSPPQLLDHQSEYAKWGDQAPDRHHGAKTNQPLLLCGCGDQSQIAAIGPRSGTIYCRFENAYGQH